MKKDIKNLNKFTSDFIVSSRGQLDYPGMNTLIPNANGRITMKGVKQNVLGIDDLGNKKIMKPKGEYQFPGNSVYEIPLKKKGGEFKKGLVTNPKKTKKSLASKKYSRSLSATNILFTENSLFKKPKSRKNKVYNPNAKYYAEGGESEQKIIFSPKEGGCPEGQYWTGTECKIIPKNTKIVYGEEELAKANISKKEQQKLYNQYISRTNNHNAFEAARLKKYGTISAKPKYYKTFESIPKSGWDPWMSYGAGTLIENGIDVGIPAIDEPMVPFSQWKKMMAKSSVKPIGFKGHPGSGHFYPVYEKPSNYLLGYNKEEEPIKEEEILNLAFLKPSLIQQQNYQLQGNNLNEEELELPNEEVESEYLEEGSPDTENAMEWVNKRKYNIDWNGIQIPYRLPRFRKPGSYGDLIKPGKKRYINLPTIESRNTAYLKEKKEGGDTGCPNGQVWSKKDKRCIDLPVFNSGLNNGTLEKFTNLSDGLIIKPLNSFSDFGKIKPKKIPVVKDSFLETLEKNINDFLDNPLKKAAQVSESLKEKGEDPSDALRHSTAGALTAQTIANKTGNIPFISNPLGYLGANIAGIGHELSTLSQTYLDDRPWKIKLQESLEDIYNNSVGANTIFNNNSEKDKINYLLKLTRTNQLPDGYGEERPFRDNPKWTDPYNQKQYGGEPENPPDKVKNLNEVTVYGNQEKRKLQGSLMDRLRQVKKAYNDHRVNLGLQKQRQSAEGTSSIISLKDQIQSYKKELNEEKKSYDKASKALNVLKKYNPESYKKAKVLDVLNATGVDDLRNLYKEGKISDATFMDFYDNFGKLYDREATRTTEEDQLKLEDSWYGQPDEEGRTRWMGNPNNVAKVAQAVAIGAPLAAAAPMMAPAVVSTLANPYVAGGLNAYFAGHGINEFSDPNSLTRKSMSRAYDDPTGSNIGDAAFDVGMNSLNFVGLPFNKAIKGSKNLINNTYKINPWAFKANPEAYYHRSPNLENIVNRETGTLQGFGNSKAGIEFSKDAGPGGTGNLAIRGDGSVSRINLKKPANSQLYFSKGVPLDGGRYNKVLNKKTGKLIDGQGYEGPYMVEVEGVPMGASTKGRAPGADVTNIGGYAVPRRPISLDEAKFYKEHWLKGYKEVPKQLPGSPNKEELVDLWRIQERGARPMAELAAEGKLGPMFQNEKAIQHFKDREKYFGQWFTKDKADFDFYKADREFVNPEIIHLQVPKSRLAEFQNYDKSLSRAADREFVIPLQQQKLFTPKQLPGFPNVVSSVDDVVKQPWQMEELPGLHLQSTMEGEAISKIVDKTGKINTEQALAIIAKESGGADKVALIKQGIGENIPKKMDFNEFRKTVQDQLIPLERQFVDYASDYGINRLGYKEPEFITRNVNGKTINELTSDVIENQTLVLSNKGKFGRGSSAHGNPDETLGHAHYLIDKESPNVLTVTQVQSDAFQGTHRSMPKNIDDAAEKLNRTKAFADDASDLMGDEKEKFKSVFDIADKELQLDKATIENFTQKSLLDKNHQERFLQELVDYAGKRGDVNKVRIPTSETAAKVQGYQMKYTNNLMDDSYAQTLVKWRNEGKSSEQALVEAEKIFGKASPDEVEEFYKTYNTLSGKYSPEQQTILKKYSEMPKTIKKLYGVEPQMVTDGKGNTWYEFNIPEKFKKGKGEIKAFSAIGTGVLGLGLGATQYKQGGATNDYVNDLTPEEIQKYIDGGYIVEEIN